MVYEELQPEPQTDEERAAAAVLDDLLAKAKIPATRTECFSYKGGEDAYVVLEYMLAKPWEMLRAWMHAPGGKLDLSHQMFFRNDLSGITKEQRYSIGGIEEALKKRFLDNAGVAVDSVIGARDMLAYRDLLREHPRARLPGRGKYVEFLRTDFSYPRDETEQAAAELKHRRDALLQYFKRLRYGKSA